MKKIAVIGAGASGLMAAYAAGTAGACVTVFEKNEKAGKKIYITGKGRCNVTNACDPKDFLGNVVSNPKFLYKSFAAFSNLDLMSFMERNGTPLKTERGNRVFPVSDHASDITKALVKSLQGLNIKLEFNKKVAGLLLDSGEIKGVRFTGGGKESFDAVIVASGGASYPGAGGTRDGYDFAKEAGIGVVEPIPSLVPFLLKEDFIKELQGLSLRNVELVVRRDGKIVYREFGELLFTHFGISGPLVLTASAYLARDLKGPGVFTGSINLKPAIPDEELKERLLTIIEENRKKQYKSFYDGLVPGKMKEVMVKLSGIEPEKIIGDIKKDERKKIYSLIRELPFTIVGTRGFNEAIITKGGVNVKEINPSTMESKKVKGLYFCGEVLDIDAVTGGFNLQCAFSTGFVAGQSAGVEKIFMEDQMDNKKHYAIAIDGPAGSGKSSIAKAVANRLDFLYVDTGALYRTVALYVIRKGIDPLDEPGVGEILKDVSIYFKHIEGSQHVFLMGEDVTGLIRTEEVGIVASKTSSYPKVRESLFLLQKEIVHGNNVVMDGRDIGTVIIPDADLKIFLTASIEARVDRRYKQLLEKGEPQDADKIKEDLIIRDRQDTTRETAPLKQAEDAVYLDSSDLSKDEVVEFILDLFEKRRK